MSYHATETNKTTHKNTNNAHGANRFKVASVKIPRRMAESSSSIKLRETNKRIISSIRHKERPFR